MTGKSEEAGRAEAWLEEVFQTLKGLTDELLAVAKAAPAPELERHRDVAVAESDSHRDLERVVGQQARPQRGHLTRPRADPFGGGRHP